MAEYELLLPPVAGDTYRPVDQGDDAALFDAIVKAIAEANYGPPSQWRGRNPRMWPGSKDAGRQLVEYFPDGHYFLGDCTARDAAMHDGGLLHAIRAVRELQASRRSRLVMDVKPQSDQVSGPIASDPEITDPRNIPVGDVEWSVRAANCLFTQGLDTLGAVAAKTADELMVIPSFGAKCLREVREVLAAYGLALRKRTKPDEPEPPPRSYGNELKERNAAIYLAWKAGRKQRHIAADFGLSSSRTRQIIVNGVRRQWQIVAMTIQLRFDPRMDAKRWGEYWQCLGCGRAWGDGCDLPAHAKDCEGERYVHWIGETAVRRVIEWGLEHGPDERRPMYRFTLADLRRQLPELLDEYGVDAGLVRGAGAAGGGDREPDRR